MKNKKPQYNTLILIKIKKDYKRRNKQWVGLAIELQNTKKVK